MDEILKDARFARIATDRKFRGGGKKQRKVEIDKRFQSMFKDERFVSKCTVDKRGRPQSFSSKENYRKYYDLKASDDSDSDSEEEKEEPEEESPSEAGSEEEGQDEEEEALEPSIKEKLRDVTVDYARGEGTLYSDSSSDDSSTEEEGGEAGEEEAVFDKWGEMDAEAERTEEVTRRLALCNMDWDRVEAEDIFLALSSFCPSSGSVRKVEIFLSEFGKERLAEEERLGPQELRRRREEEEKVQEDYLDIFKRGKRAAKRERDAMERVRQYQINRLKYYYAVIEFEAKESANSVYEECDGMEYELSASRFDLRFVPEAMEFESPTSSCHSLPNPDTYKPKSFFTTALQQGKVELTWDETDTARQLQMKKAYEMVDGDIEDRDLARNLIASSSSEDEDEEARGASDKEEEEQEEDSISKYRSLLAQIGGKGAGEEKDLEISWVPGQDKEQEAEQELTPWEKYLKKKKDKRKMKKTKNSQEETEDDIPEDVDLSDPFFAEELSAHTSKKKSLKKKDEKKKMKKKRSGAENEETEEQKDLELLVMDSDQEDRHFNFKSILEEETKSKKKKWKKKRKAEAAVVDLKTDNFDVDVADDRFAAIFSRPEYNIDPSEQNFKKTKGMEKFIGEKQKRAISAPRGVAQPSKKSRLDPEVSAALKAVKQKWGSNAKKKKI